MDRFGPIDTSAGYKMKIRANECLLDLYFHHNVCPRWLEAAQCFYVQGFAITSWLRHRNADVPTISKCDDTNDCIDE